MALVFGSGEQVDRLRRGLDIKGRVVLGVDEVVVPVVNVGDFTGAPIRRSPVRWWVGVNVPAVAAEFGQLRIFHQSPVDQLIDGIYLRTIASGTAITVGQGLAGAAGGTPARTTEIVNADNGGVVSRQVGIQFLASSAIARATSNVFMRLAVSISETRYFPAEIVIPAMPEPEDPITNAPAILLEANAVNIALDITVTGLYFDTLPLNVRT